jgi:hypothetical protein
MGASGCNLLEVKTKEERLREHRVDSLATRSASATAARCYPTPPHLQIAAGAWYLAKSALAKTRFRLIKPAVLTY